MKSLFNTILVGFFYLLTVSVSYADTNQPVQKDSIIITFGDKTRLIIYGEDRKELEKLMQYDLNALLKDLGARLDTMQGETKIYFDELDGREYLKDTVKADQDKNYVRINLRGIRIKDGETEVTITTRGVDIKDGEERVRIGRNDDVYEQDSTERDTESEDIDEGITTIRKIRKFKSPRKGFNILIGLNAYAVNNPMGYNTDDYDLRPFGSRYVSLGFVKSATLARGKSAGLHLDFGLDVAWNNLMFEGNNTIVKGVNDVSFPVILNNEGRELDLRKSKLAVPYVNFSLMPTVSFPNSVVSYLSAGMYVGYRLGGYTKTKLGADGKKDRVRSNYYLNDFRYGAALELGIRNFPDLFVHYDINTLFQDNRGPEIRMINFGIRF
ncbi:outer membrane beta-barrel protein [Arundinibacter roseus]|uniref:Outer membrane protein beta-barrel domain-containing protein n=1 Tax=Arundinibacter roseus TaxID=2070510 RepID=A0A4R4K7Q1_9BACT|nr:outer membrane beta-barrel protein [Arundinibacter roseus]TDB63657.1 hypothetical protein EZE20_15270 [Arundinibacter roseus]